MKPRLGIAKDLFALSTPQGPSGVAVWTLVGAGCWNKIHSIFLTKEGHLPKEFPVLGRQFVGSLRMDNGSADEMLMVIRGSHPFAWFELHGHGGALLCQLHQKIFTKLGFINIQNPHNITNNHFSGLAKHLNRILVKTTTCRGARGVLCQSSGLLAGQFEHLRKACIANAKSVALAIIDSLMTGFQARIHWTEPFRVALMGPPNAGKSSLLNCLAGLDRAIVSPYPGTTRDPVQVLLAIDGWPVELCDTAGFHGTENFLESQGIIRSRRLGQAADLVLWLIDGANALGVYDPPAWLELNPLKVLRLVTKADLQSFHFWQRELENISISVISGIGIDDLKAKIGKLINGELMWDESAPGIFCWELANLFSLARHSVSTDNFAVVAKQMEWWLNACGDDFVQ